MQVRTVPTGLARLAARLPRLRWRPRWRPAGLSALAALALLLPALAVAGPGADAYLRYRGLIYDDPTGVPAAPVAIVFGAGVWPDGEPSLMLADRLDAAVDLYRRGKVRRLLMTGDNGTLEYNEVAAMRRYAVARGVPADRINLDHAGFRTYDSSYRARAVFGVTRAVLVTQRYHLPRALYLAHAFGIEAVGLAAGRDAYPRQRYYDLREAAALVVAWYEANLIRPRPRYLGEPVDLERQYG